MYYSHYSAFADCFQWEDVVAAKKTIFLEMVIMTRREWCY